MPNVRTCSRRSRLAASKGRRPTAFPLECFSVRVAFFIRCKVNQFWPETSYLDGDGRSGMCARKSTDVDQNANMTPELVQRFALAWLARKFLH